MAFSTRNANGAQRRPALSWGPPALVICLALAPALLDAALARAAGPAAAAPGAAVAFEDAALPARQKELLARYASQVVGWASNEQLVRGAQQQSSKPASSDRIRQIDAAWQRGEDPEGLATALADNECAQALRALVGGNRGFGEAFVTDSRGAIVCMSRRTSDYWQGDEAKWTRSWAGGSGAVFISKVAHDDSTGLDLMHISVPIRAGGRLVGVLTVGRLLAAEASGAKTASRQ
jgi:hypothetical protein